MLFEPKLKVKVITVDDHLLVQQGIAMFLSTQENIELVGQAENIAGTLALVSEQSPDVVLMDLQLTAGESGVCAIEEIKTLSDKVQIIVLTSYHQDDYIFPAFEAGALSYLLKDIAPEELVDAIFKAAIGQPVLSPVVAKRFLRHITQRDNEKVLAALTTRELEVLKLIANGSNNAEIAEQLTIAIKTVRSHVSNILGKLHLRDRTQAAVLAWQQGLMTTAKKQ